MSAMMTSASNNHFELEDIHHRRLLGNAVRGRKVEDTTAFVHNVHGISSRHFSTNGVMHTAQYMEKTLT
jgi:hypothetical protein